jgi:lipoate-protein ligase A
LEVYNDDVPRSAPMNMALDEVFWRTAGTPRLRFYRWNHPAISFGYFGEYAEVVPYAGKYEIVRRCTGGGIVFHGEDLTYALTIPANEREFCASPLAVYAFVHEAIKNAMCEFRIMATLAAGAPANAGMKTVAKASGSSGACFANPVTADVMVSGLKVAGAAQRRSRAGLLQQGSIQNLELSSEFQDRLGERLARRLIHRTIEAAIIQQATELAASKYASNAWLTRR